MGCGESRGPREGTKASANGQKKEANTRDKANHPSDRTSDGASSHRNDSLAIPLPGDTRARGGETRQDSSVPDSADVPAEAASVSSPLVREQHAAEDASQLSVNTHGRHAPVSPSRAWLEKLANESFATTSSAPQLFRLEEGAVEPTGMADWQWWFEEVRHDSVTRDGASRRLLQDLPNRIACQHDEDPDEVELNLSTCYFGRAAPYSLGRLFAATHLVELQWVTSLRLDGNYVADEGFGVMLATMSEANERQPVLPHLTQLYLNNMNLDARTIAGLLFYLFPYDTRQLTAAPPSSRKNSRRGSKRGSAGAYKATSPTLAGRLARRPSDDFAPFQPLTKPLFPSLSFLSVSENQSLGCDGLLEMLRSLLLVHYEPRTLSMIDISWCDIDELGAAAAAEFAQKALKRANEGANPVVPTSMVLMGNPLGRGADELVQDVHSTAADEPLIRFVV